ncbi:MAG: hypothetical protein KDD62_10610, partial [Bdellovibrionales bacterium]|nr:hypothetical protein [Bdellovibrionales bacterium]
MNADQEKEFALNLRTLIYLNAVYQGRFTQLNVLSQMGHPKFKLAELSKTKDCLADIANYLEALRNGDPVIRLMLGANQGGDAQHVYLMLNSVKTELSEMAQAAKRILLDPYYFDDPDKVSFLCSCSARQLYGQDNYARKFVELGSVLGESPVVI